MAYNFDSGQFNKETTPRRLGNWEVPRWSPTKARPLEYRPSPKPICDINGHFLPGAPRGTSRCFGHYRGTWELPQRISRKVAEELQKEPPEGRFPDWLNLRVQRPEAAASAMVARMRQKAKGKTGESSAQLTARLAAVDKFTDSLKENAKNNNSIENLSDSEHILQNEENNDDPLELRNNKAPVDDRGNGPYIPGALTNPEQRHETYDSLVKDAVEQIHGSQEDRTDKFWRKVAENAIKHEEENMKIKKDETPKLPQVNVTKNFDFAKNMHVTNLEHQPLPDTLGYRNLTKIAEHRDSDIVVKPYAIGWKGYGASGPTCCTKLRVHRPKTCDPHKQEGEKGDLKARPSTSGPDLGGQYGKSMSLMDLAICWDFKPRDPKSEPRPPKHIDGSNGSKAPAVFTMVHTPKDEYEGPIFGHSNPIFKDNRPQQDDGRHSVPYFEKDMSKERRKDSCEVQYCPKHISADRKADSIQASRKGSSETKPKCDGIHGCGTPSETSRKSSHDNSIPDKLHPIKETWNNRKANGNGCNVNYDRKQNRHSLESYEKTPLAQGKLRQSSPNDSQISRSSNKNSDSTNININTKHKNCISCNGTKMPQETKPRDDYKFAFKAGNPNSVQSVSSSNGSKSVKIPKMRHPYTKKSYTIQTLTPPFSIWRDANASGYPEHWRLASVYQHAYKPPEQRRKPLIDSVFQ